MCVCGDTIKVYASVISGIGPCSRPLTSPRFDSMLLQLLHQRAVGRAVVAVENVDKVGDSEHAHVTLLVRVPQNRHAHAVVDEREEGLFHLPGGGGERNLRGGAGKREPTFRPTSKTMSLALRGMRS